MGKKRIPYSVKSHTNAFDNVKEVQEEHCVTYSCVKGIANDEKRLPAAAYSDSHVARRVPRGAEHFNARKHEG